MKKRMITLLAAATLMFGLLPVTAYADETEPVTAVSIEKDDTADDIMQLEEEPSALETGSESGPEMIPDAEQSRASGAGKITAIDPPEMTEYSV